MAIQCPVNKQLRLKIVGVSDDYRNPAQIQGEWDWSETVDDPAIADVQIDPDSNGCLIVPTGQLGQLQVSATADGDTGEGVRPFIVADVVVFTSGPASVASFEATVEDKPSA